MILSHGKGNPQDSMIPNYLQNQYPPPLRHYRILLEMKTIYRLANAHLWKRTLFFSSLFIRSLYKTGSTV